MDKRVLATALVAGLAARAGATDDAYADLSRATRFGMPVGWPDGSGYYDAQDFGVNHHLGEDWNAVTGGATDRGDPVYAIGDGVVRFAEEGGPGWGNVVRVVHRVRVAGRDAWIESLYAHLERVDVEPGDAVTAGQVIGTIGDAGGRYSPHLHFEVRRQPDLPLGGGYSAESSMHLDPSAFLTEMGVVLAVGRRP